MRLGSHRGRARGAICDGVLRLVRFPQPASGKVVKRAAHLLAECRAGYPFPSAQTRLRGLSGASTRDLCRHAFAGLVGVDELAVLTARRRHVRTRPVRLLHRGAQSVAVAWESARAFVLALGLAHILGAAGEGRHHAGIPVNDLGCRGRPVAP